MKYKINLEFIKNTVYNYSSYILSEQEKIALLFRLEQHFPNRSCKNSIYPEFAQFYQGIFHNININNKMISTELKQRLGLLVKNNPALMCHISIEQ